MPLPHRRRGATRNQQCAVASAAKPRTCPRRAVLPGGRTRKKGEREGAVARRFSFFLIFFFPPGPPSPPPPLVSRHGSDVVGCAQPSERSARRIAQPIPS